ncbi:PspC domain-containing protein [Nocardia sp. NEAU-G5]|uniref:PspC domain-containing protein n=1 Tax=Nocardia albiluteola TaxID=2842303 RepID=A0ABS6AWG2_9NOCA|nr:PspC domain-containing protein [Nocardia albiluteola]MBU3061541.1 PspC domain-containing protein [Nocardia albiluteola]
MTSEIRRLTRSNNDKWIAGVCGGIAEYFGWDATLVRLLFVLSCLLPGPQFLVYLALWIVVPQAPSVQPVAGPTTVHLPEDFPHD